MSQLEYSDAIQVHKLYLYPHMSKTKELNFGHLAFKASFDRYLSVGKLVEDYIVLKDGLRTDT